MTDVEEIEHAIWVACHESQIEDEAAAELLERVKADAQALADVRTLDEWAAQRGQHQWAIERYRDTWRVKVCTSNGVQLLPEGATPDEARAKAAAWVREQKP